MSNPKRIYYPLLTNSQIISTLTTGTSPFSIASTTQVNNLNSSLLLGSTWNSPGAIGSSIPNSGAFTSLTTTQTLSSSTSITTNAIYHAFSNTTDSKSAFIGLDGVGLFDIDRGAALLGTNTSDPVILAPNSAASLIAGPSTVTIPLNTTSSSPSTGALVVVGDIGVNSIKAGGMIEIISDAAASIAITQNVSGNSSYINFTNTTDSRSTFMGMDGVGLFDILDGAALIGTNTSSPIVLAPNSIISLQAGTSNISIPLTTVSTNHTSGSLINSGGFGNAGKIFANDSINTTSQFISTVVTGTAPLSVLSTTVVANFNSSLLLGSTWASPSSIGSGTPNTGVFTTLTSNTINITPSLGSIHTEQTFSAANNVVTPTNVTGFVFSNAVVRSFHAYLSVSIDATTPLFEEFEIRGIQKDSSWTMTYTSIGDDSNVVFSITNAGQVQYISGNETGFVSNIIKFTAPHITTV